MAASSRENDFVHLLEGMLEEAGINVLIKVHQLSSWERAHSAPDALDVLAEDREFNADVLLFRLGENIRDSTNFRQHLSGVLLPKKAYKKDTLHNTECLIVFNVFFLRIRASVESKSFCTFGLNSGCLIRTTLN